MKIVAEKQGNRAFVSTNAGTKIVTVGGEEELKDLAQDPDITGVETDKGRKLKEQINFSEFEVREIARAVQKCLVEAAREVGDEIVNSGVSSSSDEGFEIKVRYKNKKVKSYNFYIDQEDKVHIHGYDYDKELGEVGVKPSGEAVISREIFINELVKFFKSYYLQEARQQLALVIEEAYYEVLEERAALKTSTREILGKFPTLKKLIVDLFTNQYNEFIQQIDWVVPKPSTFKVVLRNNQIFFIKWLGKSFEAQIEGKKYNLEKVSSYQQALDKINYLLKYGVVEVPEDEMEDTGGDTFTEPGAGGSPGGIPDLGLGGPGGGGGEEPEGGEEVEFEEPGEEPEVA